MPIYEYECRDCGHLLDALQKISDEPLKHCPSCGKPELRKLLSAPRFRLKGSGWYETDFKDKNRRNIASADSRKPDSGSGKPESGSGKKEGASSGKDTTTKSGDKTSSKPGKTGGD